MLTIIVLLICGVGLAALAALVIYSDTSSKINRWLGSFIISGLLWLLANVFANIFRSDPSLNLTFSRLALVGSSLVPLCFVMFCFAFTERKVRTAYVSMLSLPIIGLLLSTPTTLNIRNISADG